MESLGEQSPLGRAVVGLVARVGVAVGVFLRAATPGFPGDKRESLEFSKR